MTAVQQTLLFPDPITVGRERSGQLFWQFGDDAASVSSKNPNNWFTKTRDMFFSSTVTPEQTKRLIGVGGGFGLVANLFTGGLGFNFDTLLNIAGVASLIPSLQFLAIPVAIGFLAKAGVSLLKGVGNLLTGNFSGAASNLMSAGLTALFVFPFGKIKAIKELFAKFGKSEKFLEEAVKLTYGDEAAKSALSALNYAKAIRQNPAAAKETAGKVFDSAVDRLARGTHRVRTRWAEATAKASVQEVPEVVSKAVA